MTRSITIDGLEYKIGHQGKVYTRRNGEWVRSINYTTEQIQEKLKNMLKARS